MEIPQVRANKREPESHVQMSKRGKAFLSPKMIIAEHLVELYMKSMDQKHEAHFVSQVLD